MKRNLAITLTAIMALVCANTAFASEALSKAYSEMTKAELSGLTAKYVDSGSKDYQHAVPEGFEFTSGVIGGKIADFDGDGADELLTVYAENTDKTDSLFVQMYEEKDGKAVLAAESDKISQFLTGEKGGGCVFVKKVDGNDRIFMQYTGEINSYADGADFEILGLDYNGEKFEKAFEFKGVGSAYTISVEEAESFKKAGLTDTFEFFNAFENEEGKTEYGFSPYYGGEGNEEYGSFNIGALEKDKEMLTDITVSTNIFDIYEKIGWEKDAERLAAAEKDGKITIKVNTAAEVKTEETKPETKTEPEKAADEIAVYLNGEKMSFDAAPYIENGTTRVPMRAIFEGLGAQVDWDGETKTVTAKKDGTEIKLIIGEETALVNGSENKLLVPAEIKENRTMVPLRFVSESLGAKVDWDGETKTITITNETAKAEEKPVEEEKPVKEEAEKPSVYEQDEEKYASVISMLKSGQAYAFVDMDAENDVLFVSDGAFDDLDGHNSSIEAKVYYIDEKGDVKEIGTVSSGGTAYPLAVKDGFVFHAAHRWIAKEGLDEEKGALVEYEKATVEFDKDGNESYSYENAEGKKLDGKEADDKYSAMFSEYGEAVILNFTTVK